MANAEITLLEKLQYRLIQHCSDTAELSHFNLERPDNLDLLDQAAKRLVEFVVAIRRVARRGSAAR